MMLCSKKDYDTLISAMMLYAEYDELPQVFQLKKSDNIYTGEIKEFMKEFNHDTGLNVAFMAELNEKGTGLNYYLRFDRNKQQQRTYLN